MQMDYFWLILVLIAQITWAVGIYIDKYLVSPSTDDSQEQAVGTLVLVSSFFTIIVATLIFVTVLAVKGVSVGLTSFSLGSSSVALALFVGALEVIWLIPYFYALHYSDETAAPPLLQTIPVFGCLLGFFVFGEIPTQTQVFAGGIILFGSLLLNLELLGEAAGYTKRVRIHWKTVMLMLIASFIVAFASFVFKDTAIESNYWGSAFWMSIGSFVTGLVIIATVPQYRRQFVAYIQKGERKKIGLNLLNETLDNLAILAFYGAIVFGPSTALVQSTIAYQPMLLLAIGFGLALHGSKRYTRKLSGFSLMRRITGISTILVGSLLIFF